MRWVEINDKKMKNTSKILSLLLRHKPQAANLTLDKNGWADVNELIAKFSKKYFHLDRSILEKVVAENNKKRFTFNDDGSKIRANQGHSISVELDLQSQEPPDILYHGTAKRFLDSIKEKGLIAGQRNHVHLSDNLETAITVGKRHGKVEVLVIDTKAMIKHGKQFYLSKNGVWLTDAVEKQYLSIK